MAKEQIPIRRHGIPHVETYDVTDDELDKIEKECSDVGLDLQFALFFLTLASSFLASLLLTNVEADKIYTLFVVIIVVGFLLGSYFLVKWFRSRNAFRNTIRKIRGRQVGPIGEEGKELQTSQLAELEPTEPSTVGEIKE